MTSPSEPARGGVPGRGARRRGLLAGALALALAAPVVAQEPVDPPVPALLGADVLLSVGRIVDADLDGPTVLGSGKPGSIEDRSLTVFDRVYVPREVEGRTLSVGERVRTFRLGDRVVDPETGAPVGRVLIPSGVAVVDSLAGEVAVARIEHAFGPVLTGDGVERVDPADTTAVVGSSVAGVEGYAIAYQGAEGLHPPYDVAFLRLPGPRALEPGAAVELYSRGKVRDGRRLPDVRVGRAMIVRVHGDVAAAVIYQLRRSDLVEGTPFRSVVLP